MSQNFRLFHVSNLSVRNFRIFLLMYTGSPCQHAPSEWFFPKDMEHMHNFPCPATASLSLCLCQLFARHPFTSILCFLLPSSSSSPAYFWTFPSPRTLSFSVPLYHSCSVPGVPARVTPLLRVPLLFCAAPQRYTSQRRLSCHHRLSLHWPGWVHPVRKGAHLRGGVREGSSDERSATAPLTHSESCKKTG